jgi:drug/metabolite transporter (DMT)-like permease
MVRILAVVIAGILVAVADALIKRISLLGGLPEMLRSPLLVLVLALYAGQIGFFIYVFARRMELGIVGNLQIVAFSLTTLIISRFVFHETLSPIQIVGVALGLLGALLMVGKFV